MVNNSIAIVFCFVSFCFVLFFLVPSKSIKKTSSRLPVLQAFTEGFQPAIRLSTKIFQCVTTFNLQSTIWGGARLHSSVSGFALEIENEAVTALIHTVIIYLFLEREFKLHQVVFRVAIVYPYRRIYDNQNVIVALL